MTEPGSAEMSSRSPLDRDKFAKVLSLLASDQDGEVLAAARRATTMLHDAGKRWADLAGPVVIPEGRYEQTIVMHGRVVNPPYGRTWLEAVNRLATHHRSQLPMLDRFVVDMLVQRINDQRHRPPFGVNDAMRVLEIYRNLAGEQS